MSHNITPKTVCRALSGFVHEKTVESFVRIGGDYRSAQNSTSSIQRFLNWLAQCIDKNYAVRTLSEVDCKKKALGESFMSVANEILKAKIVDNDTVNIKFMIGNEPLEIVSYPDNPERLYVRHLWNDAELSGISLPMLKTIMLTEYLRLHRLYQGVAKQINLTDFDLTGLDLRDMDFKNCSLPDLVGCRLNDIDFDMATTFKKREMCEIDEGTFDCLQAHNASPKSLVVREFSKDSCAIYGDDSTFSTGFRRLRSYDIEQIFGSDNPDLATIKRHHLQFNKDLVISNFEKMRRNGVSINLSHVDLRELDLSEMNLTFVNLSGANLTNANLKNADLGWANLGNAILWNSDFRDVKLSHTEMGHAKIRILIRTKYYSEVVQNICHQYDASKISRDLLGARDALVCCFDH